jgi:hypothetical protein
VRFRASLEGIDGPIPVQGFFREESLALDWARKTLAGTSDPNARVRIWETRDIEIGDVLPGRGLVRNGSA